MNEKEYDKKIAEALELRNAGKTHESLSILSNIFEGIPAGDIITLKLVGSLFREGNELHKALYCFDKAVESNPISPGASLGLFHSLWRLGRYDKAFDELERFLSISESEKHLMLLADMKEGFFEGSADKFEDSFRLIKKMREDLASSLIENGSE
jgi:tetratricopeptide (TPR) repeat protein